MQQTLDIEEYQNNSISNASGYTLDQLNTIQEGYSNNLIGILSYHQVVQQMLVYKLSGLPMMISDEMVDKYKKELTRRYCNSI
jgi:hypothetical protein